jgi:hypothetical protein
MPRKAIGFCRFARLAVRLREVFRRDTSTNSHQNLSEGGMLVLKPNDWMRHVGCPVVTCVSERRNPIPHDLQHLNFFSERKCSDVSSPLGLALKDIRDVWVNRLVLLHGLGPSMHGLAISNLSQKDCHFAARLCLSKTPRRYTGSKLPASTNWIIRA